MIGERASRIGTLACFIQVAPATVTLGIYRSDFHVGNANRSVVGKIVREAIVIRELQRVGHGLLGGSPDPLRRLRFVGVNLQSDFDLYLIIGHGTLLSR
jgi:hypothetical protein